MPLVFANSSKVDDEGKNDKFNDAFSSLLENVSESLLGTEPMQETLDWLKTVVSYNVPHGKQIRGRLVEVAYKMLSKDITEKNLNLARTLGWCIEILQASFLVADDIMDNGVTRRGKPCWYRVNNMGSIAFNDAFLLEHLAFQLVRKYFGNTDKYADLQDLFLSNTFRTMIGQSLDTRISKEGNFDTYCASLYDSIVVYKTSYYTVYLPIAVAMVLSGISPKLYENRTLWSNVEMIAQKIGKLFQIQDDYFDCFADSDRLGKVGTDIQEGKCTWLFVTAKDKCSAEEFRILKENYGSSDKEKVARVKEIYKTLALPLSYKECTTKLHEDVVELINMLEHYKLQEVMKLLLDKLIKRNY